MARARLPEARVGRKVAPKATKFPSFMELLADVRKRVEPRLKERLKVQQQLARLSGSAVEDMAAALGDLCLRGGKRMRAGLVFVGAQTVAGRTPPAALVDAAVALELLHAYFLVHDDWMDGDLTRRGGPSVHAMLRRRFGSEKLGDAAAILAGDWGVALATKLMAELALPAPRLRAALLCFAKMQLSAVAGQQRDLIGEDDDVELTYRLKTASYTVSGPLRLGALLAGASPKVLRALDEFAIPIGVAFQLRDDLIGAFGTQAETGKPVGSDLRAGKRTSLVLEGFKLAKGEDAKLLAAAFDRPRASAAAVRRALAVLEKVGARAAVERRIARLSRRALAAAEQPVLPARARHLLRTAAEALVERRA